VTMEDLRGVKEGAGENPDISEGTTLAANLVTLTAKVTDNDLDTASKTIDLGPQITIHDDGPTITAIQDTIMPNLSNTQSDGTWQPVFGADGANATSPISVALATGTINGITYTLTDAPDVVVGQDLKQVVVNNGVSSYTFYEYTTYDPTTHSAEVFAFTNSTATTPFFELNVKIDGTYTFHLDTNTLTSSTTTTFDALNGIPNGNGGYVHVDSTGAGSYVGNANAVAVAPTSAFPLIIDGFDSGNTDPAGGNRIFKNNNGMGVNSGNLDTNETITFNFFSQQSHVDVSIGKGGNDTTEHFQVKLYDNTHALLATEDITQADGTVLTIDAAHWTGTGVNAFQNFYEADVTNIASVAGDDTKVVLLSVTFNQNTTTTVGSTAFNFVLNATDADGDTATSSPDLLNVSLLGTGTNLTGTNTTPEVIVASSANDIITGGTGLGDTVDYHNSTSGVIVNLTAETDAVAAVVGGGATGDTIKGIENVIGSSFSDTLTAHPSGSILDGGTNSTGGSGIDTLTGGAGNDVLIASRLGVDSLTGNGGSDTFVLHGDGAASVTINDLGPTDQIVVDVANLNLTINTAQLASFTSAPTGANDQTHDSTFAANQFFFNTTTDHLYYSADHTAANAVDLAHISTGLPAAGAVHVA